MAMPDLETSLLPADGPENWAEGFAASIQAQRENVHRFLAAHRAKLERAEAVLEEQIERLEQAAADQTTAFDRDAAGGDYQRRYEMALDDLRELRESNSDLQRQLAKRPPTEAASFGARQTPGTYLNWEAEKKRILAALESNDDANDFDPPGDRVRIEEVLQTTERALAEKDREIADLRSRLNELSGAAENIAPDSADIDRAIDADALVQEERERLRQLQTQWQEKLRQAEIEISMERAKLARQRTELEEKMRLMPSSESQASSAAGAAETPARGRWLSRLGLTDADRERRRR